MQSKKFAWTFGKIHNSGMFVMFQKEVNFDSWSCSILVESSVLEPT